MTKSDALKKAGYVPIMGRPRNPDTESTTPRSIRIPDRIWGRIPRPRGRWVLAAINARMDGDKSA